MKIAVIGSGIAGLAAARYLGCRHELSLFERDDRLGGHSHTVHLETPHGRLAVDTGFVVCNPLNYPNFYALLDEIGVPRQDTDMSLGVSVDHGRIEWAGDENIGKIFAQPALALSPTHLRMLLSVLRLNRQLKRMLANDAIPAITLGDYLQREAYPMSLRVRYLAAMAGPIWSTSTRGVMNFPLAFFARFFDAHGLLNLYQRPQWQVVAGGAQRYVERLLADFPGRVCRGRRVEAIHRSATGVRLRFAEGCEDFERVVCAAHADEALAMLPDAAADETAVLGAVPYADNEAWLHTDPGLMPRRRRAWSSWNALLAEDRLSDTPIGVSYWMNKLQALPTPVDYIVSLNPPRPPRDGTVLYRTRYAHPQYGPRILESQAALPSIQGRGGLWWAGAWTGYGFHEDGLKSGLRAVAGIDRSCLPHWARL